MRLRRLPTSTRVGIGRVDAIASIAAIAVVLALGLPSLKRHRDESMVLQSQMNLLMLSASHFMYASDHNGNQWTQTPHDLAEYGDSLAQATFTYASHHPDSDAFMNGLPYVQLGWACDHPLNPGLCGDWVITGLTLAMPLYFGPEIPQEVGYGYAGLANVKSFNQYVGGQVYDPTFFAPKDIITIQHIGDCWGDPSQFCFPPSGIFMAPSSYSFSPAALHDPAMWSVREGAFPEDNNAMFQNWDTAFQMPTFPQILYPDLKTHMMERHWLQNNPRPTCFEDQQLPSWLDCQPQLFNHSINSEPVTLFYDGSIRLLPNKEVQSHEKRINLWRRDTAFGEDGYFLEYAVDDIVDLSHHVLTNGGAFGRDTLGPIPDR